MDTRKAMLNFYYVKRILEISFFMNNTANVFVYLKMDAGFRKFILNIFRCKTRRSGQSKVDLPTVYFTQGRAILLRKQEKEGRLTQPSSPFPQSRSDLPLRS